MVFRVTAFSVAGGLDFYSNPFRAKLDCPAGYKEAFQKSAYQGIS